MMCAGVLPSKRNHRLWNRGERNVVAGTMLLIVGSDMGPSAKPLGRRQSHLKAIRKDNQRKRWHGDWRKYDVYSRAI